MKLIKLIEGRRGKDFALPERLLNIDPGHTTGWSYFKKDVLVNSGETKTIMDNQYHNWEALLVLLDTIKPTHIVCENYRIYAAKSQQHIGQRVLTIRIIGGLDMYCAMHDIPIYYHMAGVAKNAWPDNKLRMLGLMAASKHARDSIRHGCHFLTFNSKFNGADIDKTYKREWL